MTDSLFPFTDEHKMIRDAARDFAQKEIAPIAAEFDESGEFPMKTIKKMGEMGFMGIEVPEEYGGAGMDTIAYVLAMEEIAPDAGTIRLGASLKVGYLDQQATTLNPDNTVLEEARTVRPALSPEAVRRPS